MLLFVYIGYLVSTHIASPLSRYLEMPRPDYQPDPTSEWSHSMCVSLSHLHAPSLVNAVMKNRYIDTFIYNIKHCASFLL